MTDEVWIAKIEKGPDNGMIKVGDVIGWGVDEESEI